MHGRLEAKGPCHMNITKLEVLQGLIANSDTSTPQLINIKATTDLRNSNTTLHWYNVGEESHFASAIVEYGNNDVWLSEWDRLTHLVASRIETLQLMANNGTASKLSRNMVYRLFANLVDYADSYRGIQSAIIHDLEAVAHVKLTEKSNGVWTIPPHFIDSICHLAGFIMNGGDALDTQDHFYVTPGWESMRFAFLPAPSGEYRSYVKMRPTNPGYWVGDVYILQAGRIVGMVGGIIFRRFPRSLLSSLFSPPDTKHTTATTKKMTARMPAFPVHNAMVLEQPQSTHGELYNFVGTPSTELSDNNPVFNLSSRTTPVSDSENSIMALLPAALKAPTSPSNSLVDRAMAIIAREVAIHTPEEMADDVSFVNLGIDSLLSLVLAEKFREELSINLTGIQFLECPTIGEFKVWIEEHC
jgi:iterative type I PKS product template protein